MCVDRPHSKSYFLEPKKSVIFIIEFLKKRALNKVKFKDAFNLEEEQEKVFN